MNFIWGPHALKNSQWGVATPAPLEPSLTMRVYKKNLAHYG